VPARGSLRLTTMASLGLLMPPGNPIGSGGLYTPSAMAFGPDGNLYISRRHVRRKSGSATI
jgi:hypothetical protein